MEIWAGTNLYLYLNCILDKIVSSKSIQFLNSFLLHKLCYVFKLN